jgi:hypothetical protein
MTPATTEPSVEALTELQKINAQAYWRIIVTTYNVFVGYAPALTPEVKHETQIVFTPWACGPNDQRIFRAPTLSEAMAQVRKWKEEQSGS